MSAISILGTLFVGALKAVAPILVFVLVISSLANAGSGIGSRFKTVITLYMLSTFLAGVVAVFGSYLFPIILTLPDSVDVSTTPSGNITEIFTNLLTNMVSNPIDSLANANYTGILFWAVVLGLAFKMIGSDQTKKVLQDVSDAVSQAVKWVIQAAPFGIMGLIFDTISNNERLSF